VARSFFFAGGGTGGHIYPAIAVAERIIKRQPQSFIHFFCSERRIDSRILGRAGWGHTALPAVGLSARPDKLIRFCKGFVQSSRAARREIGRADKPVVVGVGGFVAAPACWAAHRLGVPVVLLNVDLLLGKANRLIARWADAIFVQFEETAGYFEHTRAKVSVSGCPLRSGFANPQPARAIEKLQLDKNKKILLVTGASSGSASINEAVTSMLDKLAAFSADWQIVHLTGRSGYEQVLRKYADAPIEHRVIDYFDDMPPLLAAADLVVGRSGAVSVAEYAAAGVPSICMPYPHHKDRHQYLNAGKLVEAGAAVIVDDLPDAGDRAGWLWEQLQQLMRGDDEREKMRRNCRAIAGTNAAGEIAEALLEM